MACGRDADDQRERRRRRRVRKRSEFNEPFNFNEPRAHLTLSDMLVSLSSLASTATTTYIYHHQHYCSIVSLYNWHLATITKLKIKLKKKLAKANLTS